MRLYELLKKAFNKIALQEKQIEDLTPKIYTSKGNVTVTSSSKDIVLTTMTVPPGLYLVLAFTDESISSSSFGICMIDVRGADDVWGGNSRGTMQAGGGRVAWNLVNCSETCTVSLKSYAYAQTSYRIDGSICAIKLAGVGVVLSKLSHIPELRCVL